MIMREVLKPSTTIETSAANKRSPANGNSNGGKLTMEHALQLYMDSIEQLEIVDTKLAVTDSHVELSLYQRLVSARSTLVFKATNYYNIIKELARTDASKENILKSIADGKTQLYGNASAYNAQANAEVPIANNSQKESTSSIKVLGNATATTNDYHKTLSSSTGARYNDEEVVSEGTQQKNDDKANGITVDKLTKAVKPVGIKTVELISSRRDHKVYSEKEVIDNVALLNQKKLSPEEAQFFLLDIVYQSKNASKVEKEKLVTSAVCAIEKELYDTDYDVRHLITDAIMILYKDDEETLRSVFQTKSARRISNWVRYEMKTKNDDKIGLFLTFIKGLKFSEGQLNSMKLTDLLASASKKKNSYTNVATEILDNAAEITAKEKAARKAKIDEQNQKKAEELKKLELEKERKEKVDKDAGDKAGAGGADDDDDDDNATTGASGSAPAKLFSFKSYLSSAKNDSQSQSPVGQENIVIHEPLPSGTPVEGLKSALKKPENNSNKKKNRVMFPSSKEQLVKVRYIERQEIDPNEADANMKAKEMILSEASSLKKSSKRCEEEDEGDSQENADKGILKFEEHEGDMFWVTPMRIDFSQFKDLSLNELAETRGGDIKLNTREKPGVIYRVTTERSISPFEPGGLITPNIEFPASDYMQTATEGSTAEEMKDNTNDSEITKRTNEDPSPNKNLDQDILDLLDDDLLPAAAPTPRIEKKRLLEDNDSFINKKPKVGQLAPQSSMMLPVFESPPYQQQKLPQPSNSSYLPSYNSHPPKALSSSDGLLPNRTHYLNGENNHYSGYSGKKNPQRPVVDTKNKNLVSPEIMELRARDHRPYVRLADRALVHKWTTVCDYYKTRVGCKRGDTCIYIHLGDRGDGH